jgi:hypothetical protein
LVEQVLVYSRSDYRISAIFLNLPSDTAERPRVLFVIEGREKGGVMGFVGFGDRNGEISLCEELCFAGAEVIVRLNIQGLIGQGISQIELCLGLWCRCHFF